MEDQHGDCVLRMAPAAEHKLIYLGDYLDVPGDVPDPIGQSTDLFRASRDQILRALQRLLPEILVGT